MKSKVQLVTFLLSLCSVMPMLAISCQASRAYTINQSSDDNKQKKYTIHKVEQGQTAYSISKDYGISLQELYRLNPKAVENLNAGDELIIPNVEKIEYKSYKPQKGETIYSISKEYNTTVDKILNLNPKLGMEGLKEGKDIKVPVAVFYKIETPKPEASATQSSKKQTHKVSSKETLYSLSKQYDVTIEDLVAQNPELKAGLKKDMVITIPSKTKAEPVAAKATSTAPAANNKASTNISTLKIGVMFPFFDKDENQKQRLVEYYEGFLLAIDELKKKGHTIEIYTHDIGTEDNGNKLKSLLEASDIAALHMIIGGITTEQISLLSDFSKKNNIKYVIPLPTKSQAVSSNKNAFQVCVSHSDLYSKIDNIFVKKYSTANVIFVTDKDADDKSDFLDQLKTYLDKKGISVKQVQVDANFDTALQEQLSDSKKNVIIPSSSSYLSLSKLLTTLKPIAAKNADYDINLFGYPDWQAYTALTSDLTKFNTNIYSSFFAQKNTQTQSFEAEYKKSYNKEMLNTFPKYAMLGYDTGMYFISALNSYGMSFDSNLGKIKYSSLQTPFHFEKERDGGGYVNEGIYIVSFTDSGVTKTDYSKE